MEKITFAGDGGDSVEFYVLEETRINGVDYILVTDSDDEEESAECCIFKDLSGDGDTDSVYEAVEDNDELEAVMRVFEELMDDIERVK
jgi:hypothetical protein